jgi:murein DD-endopeptidase MepM/ murein hydrolase activator NlpD
VRIVKDGASRSRGFSLQSIASPANSRHLRWFAAGFLLPLFGGLVTYSLTTAPSSITPGVTEKPAQLLEAPPLLLPEPVAQPIGDMVEFIVGRNDTLERIFRQARLSLEDLAAIRSLPGMREALDMLRPGELITLTHTDGVLQKLTRRMSETELLSVNREEEGFAAQVLETPLEIRTTTALGTIESSLFNAGRAAGMSSELIMRMANDIFGWDIDFALDIQRDDKFTVIYERKFRDGDYLGDGQILAAEFINEGRIFRAIRFQSADGQIADYFTPDGKSMRKQFLRAPVDFKYISSNFNLRRLHPILNIRRAHQGVDYSAPTGTPIKASGDGKVVHAGVKGGYGNAIILEHGGGISSLYGHLSRFAKGTRNGARVKQGDIIGYVGSTGASTAPHLHYEYRVHGVHKNPRTVPLPDAQPIPLSYLNEFRMQGTTALAQLDKTKASQVVASPSP